MKIKKDIKVEEIVKIINTNTKETDFYLKDSNDLKVADMIKILKVGVSGKSLHISYCDVYAIFCGLAENSEEQKNDIKELKDLISAIQDFSKNNNTVYWYDEAENQEKETNEKSKSFNPDLAHIEKIIPESDDSEPEKSDTGSDSSDSGDEASSESNWGDYSDVEIIPQSPKNEQSRKDESKYIDAFQNFLSKSKKSDIDENGKKHSVFL